MSTGKMGLDSMAIADIVRKLSPQPSKSGPLPGWAKVGAAVASVFFVIGLATIIIPNFVAASSLPMPLANIRMIGILVASASLISAFPIGLIVGAREKRSAKSLDAEAKDKTSDPVRYGDLDKLESSDSSKSSSEDEISDSESTDSNEETTQTESDDDVEKSNEDEESREKPAERAALLRVTRAPRTIYHYEGGFPFETGEEVDDREDSRASSSSPASAGTEPQSAAPCPKGTCPGHSFTVSEIASTTHHASNKAANTERDFLSTLPPGTWYCSDSDDDSDSSNDW